jgi:hypothetical protein
VVHPLPPAPDFLGRGDELDALRAFWDDGGRGVLALVGLGGAGKTALAARFLAELLAGPAGRVPACGQARNGGGERPRGLFVWSFYQQPDAGLFLKEAYHYFAGGAAAGPARGAGLLHLLRDALSSGGPHLLVLDGLERVQRPAGEGGTFGQIEDPLLKGLLSRIAEGLGQTAALVTSRFPLTDLAAYAVEGYRHLDVGELDRPAALALLRKRGVIGADEALLRLVETYGAHALTLDHLGSLIGQFLGGDPERVPEAPRLPAGGDRQAMRLARLLAAYERHLPPAELALLCRLCLLRRSLGAEQLFALFLCSPPVHARTVRELAEEVGRLSDSCSLTGQHLAQHLAPAIQRAVEEALCTAPLAGPEETFRQEVRQAAATALKRQEQDVMVEVEELTRLYGSTSATGVTDERPLSSEDRDRLRALLVRYRQLRDHPLMLFHQPDAKLEGAFLDMGWHSTAGEMVWNDLNPLDVVRGHKRVCRQLGELVCKHFALRRVCVLCRVRQQKWALAGPLAALDAAGLRLALDALVSRHLVLREADGSFSVHPAVRDHFARLASAAEQGRWHDLIRGELISLAQRPGVRHPEDRATLDLVEEAIYHAAQAGQAAEAWALYEDVLGGLRHLGWKLGEPARGLRILCGFEPCPDRWALGWYLRSLGELEEAYRHNDLAYFRADVRLLQGRLPEAAAQGDDARAAVAAFLMGQTKALPPSLLGCAVPRAQVLLYPGRLEQAARVEELGEVYRDLGWNGDRARCRLVLAEVARRRGDAEGCRRYLDKAAAWVLHSGSVEHLGLMHLVRARAARGGDGEEAQRAVSEGLHLARQCGLGLYQVELLCVQAEIMLDRGDAPAAERTAGEALWRAAAVDCRFAWGEAEARHLLGLALVMQQRGAEARPVLEAALELRQRLGDPRAEETERLLAALRT